jgi:N-acetylmuramoyl-L-alanine amidase
MSSSTRKKLLISVAILFALNITIICISKAEALAYRQGSTGSVVKQIQQRLSDWGYYKGSIDGIYGSRTTAAVKYFQRKNGLTADGICGNATLKAIGISPSGGTPYSNNVNLLARLISAEARGEPYVGQVAVGAVVLNRIEHPSFPDSLSGVIYQPGAFTCVTDGQFYGNVEESAYKAARDALNGWDPSGGAIYYFNPATATSGWIWSRPEIITIGEHIFCS